MRSPNMQPATDPATRAFHEQILRTAGLWDKPQQTDAEAEAILAEYEERES